MKAHGPERGKPGTEHARESGFSMIEMLVVVIIMGILMVGVIRGMGGTTATAKLKQATDEIASTLKLARQRAVATSSSVVVQFNGAEGEFYLFDDRDEDGTHDSDETSSGPFDVPKGISIASVGFTSSRVTFGPRGSASQSSNVVVANARRNAQRVDVTAATGLIYVSDIYALDGDLGGGRE